MSFSFTGGKVVVSGSETIANLRTYLTANPSYGSHNAGQVTMLVTVNLPGGTSLTVDDGTDLCFIGTDIRAEIDSGALVFTKGGCLRYVGDKTYNFWGGKFTFTNVVYDVGTASSSRTDFFGPLLSGCGFADCTFICRQAGVTVTHLESMAAAFTGRNRFLYYPPSGSNKIVFTFGNGQSYSGLDIPAPSGASVVHVALNRDASNPGPPVANYLTDCTFRGTTATATDDSFAAHGRTYLRDISYPDSTPTSFVWDMTSADTVSKTSVAFLQASINPANVAHADAWLCVKSGSTVLLNEALTTTTRRWVTFKSFGGANATDVPLRGVVNYGPFSVWMFRYGYLPIEVTTAMSAPYTPAGWLVDTNVVASRATAAAYTSLATAQQLYDYSRYWQSTSTGAPFGTVLTKAGATVNLGSMNLVVDATAAAVMAVSGSTITIKASAFDASGITTTGTVSTANGATISGSYTDASGAHTTITIPSLVSGSRVYLRNMTDGADLVNAIVAATSYTLPVTWTANKSIRLRVTYASGTTAKLPIELTGTLTSAGLAFTVTQVDDAVFNTLAIDGSTCTEFTPDYPNLQIDIADLDGVTTVQRIYAWAAWAQTSSAGVAQMFNAVTALDTSNFVVDQAVVNVKLDNVNAAPVRLVGGYLSRKDGSTIIAATSGSIQMDPGKAYTVVGTGATAAEIADKVLGRSLAGGSDGGRTVRDALRLSRNKWTVGADGTMTVYAEDDTTTAWTAATSKRTADNQRIVGVDPA